MNLEKYVRMFSAGDGMVRVIDPEGNVIEKHLNPTGGNPIDFISAEYAQSQGKIQKKKEREANFMVFKMK
ncbi:MAG: hypothetical protein VW058_08435 [Flavobacteriaceae bacterium]